MADDQPPSSTPNTYYSSKSVFSSPKFRFFSSKITPFDSDFSIISPTSILEANPSIFSSKNPKPTSFFEPTIPKPQRFHPPDAAFGLADLVKNRDSSNRDHSSKPVNKMVLFGSKLRVQIPSADFGTKTGAAGMRHPPGQLSPCLQTKVLTVSEIDQTEDYTRVISHGPNQTGAAGMRHPPGQLSPCLQTKVLTVSEIDQTEDYTRVISHGPNPTITHIFDNSVFVEATPCSVPLPQLLVLPMETKKTDTNFLSYCYTCKKNLDQKQDIYIYRGEKGFCSSECRYQEMLLDQIES